MLDDAARKVLTVMWNLYRNDPSIIVIADLCKKTQRNESQIKEAINHLVKEDYVLWDKQSNTFRVLYNREEAKPAKWRGWST